MNEQAEFASREREALKMFTQETEVDGITMDVHWDDGYNEFVLYFPDVDIGSDEAIENGVSDQVIRLDNDRSEQAAQSALDYARGYAEKFCKGDVYFLAKHIRERADSGFFRPSSQR